MRNFNVDIKIALSVPARNEEDVESVVREGIASGKYAEFAQVSIKEERRGW